MLTDDIYGFTIFYIKKMAPDNKIIFQNQKNLILVRDMIMPA